MKKREMKVKNLVFMMLLLFFTAPTMAIGDELPISVQAILPENQQTKDAGYYDLKVTSGQEQELEFKLYNSSDKEVTVNVEINPAYTGDGGAFVYSQNKSKADDSLIHSLSDLAVTPKTVSIPAKGEVISKIQLTIPKKEFQGIILGGIRITGVEKGDEKEDKKSKEGFTISNNIAYSIAVRLIENEALPTSDLLIKGVFVDQITGRNTVKVNLQNPTPTIIDKVSYQATVSKKGSSEVLHETNVSNYRVAPNTNYNLPISWENQPFEAGTYSVKVLAQSEETKQKWELTQDFTISPKEARDLNEKAIDLEQNNLKWFIYGGIILGIIIVVLCIVLIILSRKKKAERRKKIAQQRKRKMQKKKMMERKMANQKRKK